ncbi:MAG: outer membrane beta-barrel protein [Flavobacteriales bacterium]|nr:outer membrane beta-barrel protein [Flavobacteriales bacterium]
MLRRSFHVIALFGCAGALWAQQPSSGLGSKAGPQLTSWRSAATKFRPVPGFLGGVYAPLGVGNRIEVQPELLLSYQGAAQKVREGGTTAFRALNLQFPVMAKFFLDHTINLQAGAFGAYSLMVTTDGKDAKDRMQTTEMGLVAGIGMDGMAGLDLTLRYSGGMTELLKQDDAIYPTSRAVQLTCGYRFVQFGSSRSRRR